MKKIALLRSYPKEATFGRIANTLSKAYKLDCFIWDRQRDYQPIAVNNNISYVKCRIKAGYYNLNTFLKLFLFEIWLLIKLPFARVDFIHAIDLDTGFVGLIAAKLLGKPFVYQCLDPYYTVLPKRWPKFLAGIAKSLENFVITHADLFIITDLLRLPQHEGARPKRVVEIANVTYPTLSRSSPAANAANEDFIVGYIGSLAEGRSLITVIETIGELKDHGVKLIIGGFGPLAGVIGESARNYPNVTYRSWVPFDQLFELESGFDLFVYVTDRDNEAHRWVSPTKLFTSMAFGRPIIVGEGTLSAKRISAVGNGVAVPYGSKEDLLKAILMFKENPAIAKEMGARGRDEFERNWRPEIMAKRLLESYARLEGDGATQQDHHGTEKESYTERLISLESKWKKLLDVQRPYRMHLQRLQLGFVLDIGCGLGRNLVNLGGSSAGVGIDHNPLSVSASRSRGLVAFTPEEFKASAHAKEAQFDTLLLSHVAEHMIIEDVLNILRTYLIFLRPGGRVVFITPQERGFHSDPTHVLFMDFATLAALAKEVGLKVESQYSFPFPRFIGHFFKYNEFITICRKPETA